MILLLIEYKHGDVHFPFFSTEHAKIKYDSMSSIRLWLLWELFGGGRRSHDIVSEVSATYFLKMELQKAFT